MYSLENFLKRNDRHHRGHNIMSRLTTHDRCCHRHCHFLTGTNDLRPAYDHATTTHFSEHLANPLIKFSLLNVVRLKSSVEFAANRPDGQGNQVRIFFQGLLQTRIITSIVKRLDSTSDFKCLRQTIHHIAVALAVEFDLPGLVLHQLRLITALNRPQFLSAASGKQSSSER